MVRKSIIRLRGRKELYNIGGLSNILAAYCVAGHHAGLPDGGAPGEGAGTPTLHGRMAKELEDYSDFLKKRNRNPQNSCPTFKNPLERRVDSV